MSFERSESGTQFISTLKGKSFLAHLSVRVEVLKGEVIYCKDTRFLYKTANSTVKDFEEFKPRFYDYIGGRAIE